METVVSQWNSVLDRNQARVSLKDVSDRPGIASEIFTKLADENIECGYDYSKMQVAMA